jgi:hypothetical protein
MIYQCCDERRREAVLAAIADGQAINGIDYVEVLDREAPDDVAPQETLLLRFLGSAPDLPLESFQLTGGERVPGVRILWAMRADTPATPPAEPGLVGWLGTLPTPDQVIVLRTSSSGDYSGYRIRLVSGPGSLTPPAGIDRVLSEVGFSFKVECPTDFDCKPQTACPPEATAAPALSYLAKDYDSFRRLMLGRMAQIMPDWRERSPADLGITLVEMLAYTADRLSYAQDAAATESYLRTARRRSSVRRHARLLDYHMHDGANARVWLHVEVNADVVLPWRTQFATRLPGFDTMIAGDPEERDARALRPLIFETFVEDPDVPGQPLRASLNRFDFYEWGDSECCLPGGATRATLAGHHDDLAIGHVLIFEERVGPRTGEAADADPGKRHAVRLTAVQSGETDTLTGDPITEVRWADEDALHFAFCLSSLLDEAADGAVVRRVSHALGNVVLADHGESLPDEDLGTVSQPHLELVADGDDPCDRPAARAVPPRFQPVLAEGPVTQSAPWRPTASAVAATEVGLASRRPHVTLITGLVPNEVEWTARFDLLQSFPGDTHIVVETERDGRARLRFGDDRNAKRPAAGAAFHARYRVGNGSAGNVGRDAIRHVFLPGNAVTDLRNPLPATGGQPPESMEQVRQAAPFAYRRQERAVTEADYAEVARRHPDVQRAAATFRWNGHGHTVFVTVDRFGGRPIGPEFEDDLRAHLEAFRMAGYDLEVNAPHFVAVEMELFICVGREHFRAQVRQEVLRALGAGVAADGSRGFFHPDNFTFGQPLYLSAIYARLMLIEGVASVEARLFRRRGSTDPVPLLNGVLTFGRLEIAQLDNDRNFPERGTITIEMGGGK